MNELINITYTESGMITLIGWFSVIAYIIITFFIFVLIFYLLEKYKAKKYVERRKTTSKRIRR